MIRYETRGPASYITLDTPETSNKFTYGLMNDFIDALKAAGNSGAIALVIKATGKDFTLGRDQSERRTDVSRTANLSLILTANSLLRNFPGVSISLIQGRAMGFGSGIALHSSISVGAQNCILGYDEIKHGLAPLVVMHYLPRYVGPKVAADLIYTGRDISADEAFRLNMLSRVVPADQLEHTAEKIVEELSSYPAGAIRLLQRYEQKTRQEAVEPNILGIDMLVEWIENGKPDILP